jgi:hypothetical protein
MFMAEKFSTNLRNYLMGEGSFRKCFEDGAINVYSGTAPDSPDDAVTSTLLLRITKASGTLSANERSTAQLGLITIGSHALGETFIINVTVDGVGPTSHTYTNTPDAGGVADVAVLVARMLNDIPQLDAIASGSDGNLFIKSRIDGQAFTIADGGGTGTISVITSSVVAAVRSDGIQFGVPVSGVISKEAGNTWSGVVLVSGTAGYFRLVTPSDDGTESTTQSRVQGVVSTSGAEINAASAVLTKDAVIVMSSLTVTFPEV